MRVSYAILASDATPGASGNPDVKDLGLDTIMTPGFPAEVRPIVLLVCIEGAVEDCEQPHILSVEVVTPYGKVAGAVQERPFVIRRQGLDPTRTAPYKTALRWDSIIIQAEGRHDFRVRIDNDQMALVPLYVIKA